MSRLVGIDFGMARLGMAISDERKILATSLGVVQADTSSNETVKRVVERFEGYKIEGIIVGLPLHLNGKKGLLADEVHHFISILEKAVSCPVLTWDERLSTRQAERSLKEGKMSRKKRAQVIDAVAAVLLLQNYLDSLPQNSYV